MGEECWLLLEGWRVREVGMWPEVLRCVSVVSVCGDRMMLDDTPAPGDCLHYKYHLWVHYQLLCSEGCEGWW